MLTAPYIAHIDSDYRTSGDHSNFTYNIDLPSNYDRVAILSASIPKSFYLINSPYNTLYLYEFDTATEFSITPGNYSIKSLATELQTKLNAYSTYGYTYTVTYPSATEPQTGKLTFSVSNNGGVQPALWFRDDTRLYKPLGFTYQSFNSFTGDQLISTYVCQLTISEIYLKSSVVMAQKNNISDSILCSINVINTADYSAISYQPNDIQFASKPYSGQSSCHFIFTDNDDNVLDFNGISCNFDLVFYKFNDYYALQKRNTLINMYEDIVKSIPIGD